jgi:hypothetical protein
VHGLGFGRGIGAELLGEEPPAALVDAKRLGRVAGGRMGLHQPAVAALAERLELGHFLGVPDRFGELACAEPRVAQAFERAHEDIAEVAPFLFYPGAVLAGQEASPSERGGHRRLRARLAEVTSGERRFGSLERLLRRIDVDPGASRQGQLVTAERAREGGCAVDATLLEHCAQLRHQHPERLLPGRRGRIAPEHLRELVARYRPPVLSRQVGEQDPTLPAGEALLVDTRAVRLDEETLR